MIDMEPIHATPLGELTREVASRSELRTIGPPRISYHRALLARFTWQGVTYTVNSCPIEVLRAFLEHHCSRALEDYQQYEILEYLDYGETGRWQAVDTALCYRAVLPMECAS